MRSNDNPNITAAAAVSNTAELIGGAIVIAIAFAGTLVLAAMHDYVCEDAMFYLRYARNLVEGNGLVYNPGEYYESNTAFLWTILLAPAFWLGADPVYWFRGVGLAAALAAIAATYIAARLAGARLDGIFAAVLLGFHSSFAAFAVVGFAPHLPPLFVLGAAVFALRLAQTSRPAHAAAAGICLLLAVMSRLDGAVIAAPFGLFVLWAATQNKKTMTLNLALCAALPALLFAVYLFAKHAYYGNIFPATYYAKADLPEHIKEWYDAPGRGFKYAWFYMRNYLFIIAAPFALWGAREMAIYLSLSDAKGKNKKKKSAHNPRNAEYFFLLACAAAVLAQFLYIVRIGGGYHEFRFWVPAAPLIFILIARALRVIRPHAIGFAAAAVLIAASFWHAANYDLKWNEESQRVSLAIKYPCYDEEQMNRKEWTALGDFFMRSGFGEQSPDIKVALTAGGVIPYYSRLHSLELHGWADTRVFKPGNHYVVNDPYPGHQHLASFAFINEAGIHLYMGDPYVVDIDDDVIKEKGAEDIFFKKANKPYLGLMVPMQPALKSGAITLPPDAKIVEIPMRDKKLVAIYWTRTEKLDNLFADNNITLHDIPPLAEDEPEE